MDEIHRSVNWLPPMAFLSPGQTLLAVHKHIEAEESNKLTLLNSTGDGNSLVSVNTIDRNRNHSPYKRVQLSPSMDSSASERKSAKLDKGVLKEISPSEDSAESRLAAFYKSGLTNSSESCGGELQKSNATAIIPAYDGTEPSSSAEVDDEQSPSSHLQKKKSGVFNNIAAAANSAEDLCQIFGIASPSIFKGGIGASYCKYNMYTCLMCCFSKIGYERSSARTSYLKTVSFGWTRLENRFTGTTAL